MGGGPSGELTGAPQADAGAMEVAGAGAGDDQDRRRGLPRRAPFAAPAPEPLRGPLGPLPAGFPLLPVAAGFWRAPDLPALLACGWALALASGWVRPRVLLTVLPRTMPMKSST